VRCPTITPDEQVSDAQVHRQNPNIEPLTPPMRLMFFLIAAFCRLAKSLSHSQQMGWLVGAVGIEPTTLNSNALPLQGLALCPLPEVPIQTPQTVLSFTSRDPRDDEPVLVDLKSHNVVYPTVWYL
jgi:hypothetical protein